jgi:DNA-binding HxlR family transcriptional regulator
MERPANEASSLGEALAAVGDRWTLLVVAALLDGAKRFNDLLEAVPGIAPNVLSARLRQLEGEGLAVAEAYSSRPPRSVYELTAGGRALTGVISLLADWGARHSEEVEPRRHPRCGTPLEWRWYCPTCERPVEGDEGEEDLDYV